MNFVNCIMLGKIDGMTNWLMKA